MSLGLVLALAGCPLAKPVVNRYSPRTANIIEACGKSGLNALGNLSIGFVTTQEAQMILEAQEASFKHLGMISKTLFKAVFKAIKRSR